MLKRTNDSSAEGLLAADDGYQGSIVADDLDLVIVDADSGEDSSEVGILDQKAPEFCALERHPI